jgi:hypothetical protein
MSKRKLLVTGASGLIAGQVLPALRDRCIIRPMPTIDSDGCRPPVPGHADQLFRRDGVQFFRDAGIVGRRGLESVDGMLRNPGR